MLFKAGNYLYEISKHLEKEKWTIWFKLNLGINVGHMLFLQITFLAQRASIELTIMCHINFWHIHLC